jgi:hypothetical protein
LLTLVAHLFTDDVTGSVVEVYVGNGERVLTLTINSAKGDGITLSGSAGTFADVDAWPLAQ